MGAKIRALVEFLEAGGKRGLITNPSNIGPALAGGAGTLIIPD
jgi:carbamate kinase